MQLEQALQIVEQIVQSHKGRGLNQAEKLVLVAAWEDQQYKEVAENSPYTTSHLQRYVGAEMWRLLSEHLGGGEQITKKTFRWYIEQELTNSSGDTDGLQIIADRHSSSASPAGPEILGGQPPSVSNFYGRVPLLALLRKAITEDRCVVLTGSAGIGKSALAAKLIEEIQIDDQPEFDAFIWKSIHYAPPFSALITELIRLLVPEFTGETSTQEKISLLIEALKSRSILLVLDGAEAILKRGRMKLLNPYGECAEYGHFINRIIEAQHHSCLLLTSREPFSDVIEAHNTGRLASCVQAEGLGKEAIQILQERELQDDHQWGDLIASYRGNPLALRMLASRIERFFGGSVEAFRECDTLLVNDIFKASLDELFGDKGRLNDLERKIMQTVAQVQEPIAFKCMLEKAKQESSGVSVSELIGALEALEDRFLIEKIQGENGRLLYTVQPVIRKYVLSNQSGLNNFLQAG